MKENGQGLLYILLLKVNIFFTERKSLTLLYLLCVYDLYLSLPFCKCNHTVPVDKKNYVRIDKLESAICLVYMAHKGKLLHLLHAVVRGAS